MGNRHGGEKPKEEKKKKRKEKKPKHKGKKKLAAGSDVDVDMESSHISHADSESMVFHSAENLSPYLDASTRSEEGATCAGFNDNSHILSSRDFHDGFSIEACLPADLAAVGRIDDVTASAHEDLTSSGERSSSRASSSTIDTNAAHCIERLEELERNIERTIIEKFSDGTSPLPKRRADRGWLERQSPAARFPKQPDVSEEPQQVTGSQEEARDKDSELFTLAKKSRKKKNNDRGEKACCGFY
nr:hypothetical protein BaRGS_011752 [Batillaria attramentaria]